MKTFIMRNEDLEAVAFQLGVVATVLELNWLPQGAIGMPIADADGDGAIVIALKSGQGRRQKILTLLHECAHILAGEVQVFDADRRQYIRALAYGAGPVDEERAEAWAVELLAKAERAVGDKIPLSLFPGTSGAYWTNVRKSIGA